METQNSKTWLWVVVAAVVVAVAGWLWLGYYPATAPETAGPALGGEDTTAAIDQELNATDFGDLEKELQATDADLNAL